MTTDDTPLPRIIAVQEIWVQASADYNAVVHRRTAVFDANTPLRDVLAWSKRAHCLQAGQVTLTEEDAAPATIGEIPGEGKRPTPRSEES